MKRIAIIVSIIILVAACKPEKHKPLRAFFPRSEGIEKDYIGGAIVEFDSDGNMIVSDLNRENRSFRKSPSGIIYKFIKTNNSLKPLIGDVLVLNFKYTTENDSVLFDSNDAGNEFKMRLDPPSHKGSIEEAFLMMSEGDSAIFKVDATAFYTKTRRLVLIPEFVNKDDRIVFYVKLQKIIPKEDFGKEMSVVDRKYASEELSLINRFLLTEELEITPKSNGLYFHSLKPGGSQKVKPNSNVSVRYKAMFLDGGVFDIIDENEEPFTFNMGKEEVLPGVEEAVSYMSVGEKALVIIPFRLAYGSERNGNIPPYSTLLFEITLVNAK